jgi:hypothetical protein
MDHSQRLKDIITILQEINSLLASYLPLLEEAMGFIVDGNWQGLLAWLEDLVANPRPASPSASNLRNLASMVRATLVETK